jgi:hypothetical protein
MAYNTNGCLDNNRNKTCNCCSPCCPCPDCCPSCCCSIGPTGPTGPRGPIGPAAIPGAGNLLSGLQAQLSNAENGLLANGTNVIFDQLISRPDSHISYCFDTGEFTVSVNKRYYVSWWIAINGTEQASIVEIAVAVDGNPVLVSSSPQVTCQMAGAALISIETAPQCVSLMNVTGDILRYAPTTVQANVVFMELIN